MPGYIVSLNRLQTWEKNTISHSREIEVTKAKMTINEAKKKTGILSYASNGEIEQFVFNRIIPRPLTE